MNEDDRLVSVTELTLHVDDRGDLFEVLRRDDMQFIDFGQAYVVQSRAAGTVRAFHRHERMWDHFCIVSGSAMFQFVDDEPEGDADAAPYRITASARKPVLLHVPPGVWHGWVSLEPNTLLLSIASEPYCGDGHTDEADEERVSPDTFGASWEVEAK